MQCARLNTRQSAIELKELASVCRQRNPKSWKKMDSWIRIGAFMLLVCCMFCLLVKCLHLCHPVCKVSHMTCHFSCSTLSFPIHRCQQTNKQTKWLFEISLSLSVYVSVKEKPNQIHSKWKEKKYHHSFSIQHRCMERRRNFCRSISALWKYEIYIQHISATLQIEWASNRNEGSQIIWKRKRKI